MNGPYFVGDYGAAVRDIEGNIVARGDCNTNNETTERAHAEMICAALNSVYYAAEAAKWAAEAKAS